MPNPPTGLVTNLLHDPHRRQLARSTRTVLVMALPAWLAIFFVIALPMLVAGIFLVVRVAGARIVHSDHPRLP